MLKLNAEVPDPEVIPYNKIIEKVMDYQVIYLFFSKSQAINMNTETVYYRIAALYLLFFLIPV